MGPTATHATILGTIRDEILDTTVETSLHSTPTLCELILNLVDLVVAREIKKQLLSAEEVDVRLRRCGKVQLTLSPGDWSHW